MLTHIMLHESHKPVRRRWDYTVETASIFCIFNRSLSLLLFFFCCDMRSDAICKSDHFLESAGSRRCWTLAVVAGPNHRNRNRHHLYMQSSWALLIAPATYFISFGLCFVCFFPFFCCLLISKKNLDQIESCSSKNTPTTTSTDRQTDRHDDDGSRN